MFLLTGPAPVAPLKTAKHPEARKHLKTFYKSHRSVIYRDRMILTWLCSRTRGSSPAPRGTCGFSHFSKSTRNRERQAMSDGINSEREYSGGQWFLNHLRGWTRSASSQRCNHAAGTPIGAKSAGTGKVKKLRLLIGWWQVIWKMADSCLMIISSIFKKRRFTLDDVQRLFSYISCERGKTRRYSFIYFFFYFQCSNLKVYSKSLYLSLEEANTVQRGLLINCIHM